MIEIEIYINGKKPDTTDQEPGSYINDKFIIALLVHVCSAKFDTRVKSAVVEALKYAINEAGTVILASLPRMLHGKQFGVKLMLQFLFKQYLWFSKNINLNLKARAQTNETKPQ